jgi:hypothetical protein
VYSEHATFTVGYNELFVRIKDGITGEYIEDARPTWMPVMHMEMMNHSAPYSVLTATDRPEIYSGYVVFQMAGNATEYWDITVNYQNNDVPFAATARIDVVPPADGLRRVQVFTGSDDARYVLALREPKEPMVAVQDITALLFTMESMMSFPIVENYSVSLDPRMPGMGNHSSPNNEAMVFNTQTQQYEGKVSFTMTGYWRLNLKLLNEQGDVLKGEDVTEANPESSLYFEVEL